MSNEDPQDAGEVVHGIHTQTAVFVSEEGEKFPYFQLECIMANGRRGPNLLFNPQLSIGIAGDIVAMLKVMFGITELTDDQLRDELNSPIDWDSMPKPPIEGDV